MLTWCQLGGSGAERMHCVVAPVRPERAQNPASLRIPVRIQSKPRRERGSAMVEVALMAPWIFFLFVGVFDFGFYAYSMIALENAARSAAIQTAAGDSSLLISGTSNPVACVAAWNELSALANVYSATAPTDCTGLPSTITVVTETLCGSTAHATIPVCPNGSATSPSCSDCDGTTWTGKTPGVAVTSAASSRVTVTYQTVPLIPIPGILPGQLTITRIAEARILEE